MFCKHCGAELPQDAAFCPACGQTATANEPDQSAAYVVGGENGYDPQDVAANKALAILSYVGLLFLLPLLLCKQSPFAQAHAKRGANLCIIWAGVVISLAILTALFRVIYLWPIAYILITANWLLNGGFIALAVLGIINAAKGQVKDLPVIGKIRFIK